MTELLYGGIAAMMVLLSATGQPMVYDCSNSTAEYVMQASQITACDTMTAEGEDSLIVVFKTNGADISINSYNPAAVVKGPDNQYTVAMHSADDARILVEALNNDPDILYAEEDSIVTAAEDIEYTSDGEIEDAYDPVTASYDTDATSEDVEAASTYTYNSYGVTAMGFGEIEPYATVESGSINVAVIDSGCCMHELIAPKVKTLGYDFVDSDDDPTNDGSGHGTHCAGIVADATRGMNVYIIPYRVLNDANSGKVSSVVYAINLAVEEGADIINLSLTVQGAPTMLSTAIQNAISSGVTVVAAAGNQGVDLSVTTCYPGSLTYSGLINVASVTLGDTEDSKASYSNYGGGVDLSAYGSSISSCLNASTGLQQKTGTSQAAPHVAAAAAVLDLVYGKMSPSQVESTLISLIVKPAGTVPGVPDLTAALPTLDETAAAITLETGMTLNADLTDRREFLGFESTWSSSDPDIVSVSGTSFTAVSAGTAQLTLTRGEDPVCTLTVNVADDCMLAFPALLQTINTKAFSGDTSIRLVSADSGSLVIGMNAFNGCAALDTLLVNGDIASIDSSAFSACGNVSIICKRGTAAASYAAENGMGYLYFK